MLFWEKKENSFLLYLNTWDDENNYLCIIPTFTCHVPAAYLSLGD